MTAVVAKQAFVRELLGRSDYAIISDIVSPGARVLDLGCGEGELLQWLAANKSVDARGVEIAGEKVRRAIARGVSVFQGDIDEGLADYPDRAFDYVILSQTLQETRQPRKRAARNAARGTPGDRGLPQLRPLAGAAFHAGQRPRAAHQAVPVRMVRLAEHSLPHGGGF